MFPLILPLRHPLGAGSSAGDVLSNPTVREGRRESHPPLFWIHFNALMPWIFFFLKKKYIYIYLGCGGKGNFFLFGFDKMGCEFLKAITPGLSHWRQHCKGGRLPRRWVELPPPQEHHPLYLGSSLFSMRN